jgi:hypothetical protein
MSIELKGAPPVSIRLLLDHLDNRAINNVPFAQKMSSRAPNPLLKRRLRSRPVSGNRPYGLPVGPFQDILPVVFVARLEAAERLRRM